MRKQFTSLATAALAAVSLSSCLAGPHQLRRTVEDWDQEMYVNSPLLDGVLWVVPFWIPLTFGAWVGDFCLTDAYSFWFRDVWAGEGVGFDHSRIDAPAGKALNMLHDSGGFMKVKK